MLQVTQICGYCDRPYKVKKSHAHLRKNCGRKCMGLASRTQVEVVCDQCGAALSRYPSKAKKRNFCNKTCSGLWSSENVRGANHHGYIDGRSIKYPDNFDGEFRAAIRRRDDYTCAVCGKKGKSVHHINYDKTDTRVENCVVLCRPCHSKTNGDRAYWERVLVDYMAGRGDVSIKPGGWREDLTEQVLLAAFEKRGSIRQMSDELSVDRRAIKRILEFYEYRVVRRRAKKGYGWDNYLERIDI